MLINNKKKMELIDSNSDLLTNKNKRFLWTYFRKTHMYYLLSYGDNHNLDRLLNEYLLVMNNQYGYYNERFLKKEHRFKGDCRVNHKNDYIGKYCDSHLLAFKKIILDKTLFMSDKSTKEEFDEMVIFYDDILEYVDTAMEKKFMYGEKIKDDVYEEIEYMPDWIDFTKLKDIRIKDGKIENRRIEIKIPKSLNFGIDSHKILNKKYESGCKYTILEDDILLSFNNNDTHFSYIDIHYINSLFGEPFELYIDWENTTKKKLCVYYDSIIH